jgi:hypothetical protein
MPHALTSIRLICAAVLFVISAGCSSSGPDLADVTGTITLDSEPLVGCTVTFRPKDESGKLTSAYGGTNSQGVYSLQFTRDKSGVMPGEYFVDIETQKLTKRDLAEMKAQGLPEPPPFVPIPKKYKQPGALSANVNRGKNQLDFALESK